MPVTPPDEIRPRAKEQVIDWKRSTGKGWFFKIAADALWSRDDLTTTVFKLENDNILIRRGCREKLFLMCPDRKSKHWRFWRGPSSFWRAKKCSRHFWRLFTQETTAPASVLEWEWQAFPERTNHNNVVWSLRQVVVTNRRTLIWGAWTCVKECARWGHISFT